MEDNKELLLEIKDYISNANNKIICVIEDIRQTNQLDDLLDLLEGLTFCFHGLNLIKTDNIETNEEFLKEKISEILDGVENQDYNLIVDILEYEILQIVEDLNIELKNI